MVDLIPIVIEQIRFKLNKTVSREVLDSVTVRVEDVSSFIADEVVIVVGMKLGATRLEPVTHESHRIVEFEAPADWWQHAKMQYGRKWWMRLLRRLHFGHHACGEHRSEVRFVTHRRIARAEMTVEPLVLLPQCDRLPESLGRKVLDLNEFRAEWTVEEEGGEEDARTVGGGVADRPA